MWEVDNPTLSLTEPQNDILMEAIDQGAIITPELLWYIASGVAEQRRRAKNSPAAAARTPEKAPPPAER